MLKKIIYRVRYGKPLVIVSGIPRSGTSLLMQMLSAGGLPVVDDDERKEDVDNPRGYCELARVRTLNREDDQSWLADCRGKGLKIISPLLRELPLTLNYKVIFVLRNIDEILASQRKMLEHRNEPCDDTADSRMRTYFEDHVRIAHSYLKHTRNFQALFVDYGDVIRDPTRNAAVINAFVSARLDEAAMAEAVEPGLYRNRNRKR